MFRIPRWHLIIRQLSSDIISVNIVVDCNSHFNHRLGFMSGIVHRMAGTNYRLGRAVYKPISFGSLLRQSALVRWTRSPYFEGSLCLSANNIIRSAYMNLRRPCGTDSKSDTKDTIQTGLRQHDVIPGRYTTIERAVQIVEGFKG